MGPGGSLRVRLPLFIAALIAAVLLAFVWAAHRTVESTLAQAGGERALGAAQRLADILNIGPALAQLRLAGADPVLRRALQAPSEDATAAASARLQAAPGNRPRIYEIWNDAGARVVSVSL